MGTKKAPQLPKPLGCQNAFDACSACLRHLQMLHPMTTQRKRQHGWSDHHWTCRDAGVMANGRRPKRSLRSNEIYLMTIPSAVVKPFFVLRCRAWVGISPDLHRRIVVEVI